MYYCPLFVLIVVCVGFSSQDPVCGTNEIYDKCGSTCVATCQNRQFAHCSPDCVPDCYCKSNYIRDEDSKKCVLVRDCPRY
ncbi:hypothetical protein HHI36_020728 [Cryptolaemus montrouzieri]|uniref:TIL domain-containing protein n=1 Tax=Cryptolaemus montrouzieri TaxID=559131 RepID=A0ABD2NBW9_9CUCU